MTDYEAGYLQALRDTQLVVRQMVNDPNASPAGKNEMLRVVSFLDGVIRINERGHATSDATNAPNPLGSSFWAK